MSEPDVAERPTARRALALAFSSLAPNARAKGRGRADSEKTHQSITPRPLERRVGPGQGRHFADGPTKKPEPGEPA